MKCTTPPYSKGYYHFPQYFPESGPKSMPAEGRSYFGSVFSSLTVLSFCCQLTGIEQSNPRAQLSFPGIHIPTPKHSFATAARQVTFFPGSQLFDEPGYSQFLGCKKRNVLFYSYRKKKAFRSITPGSQHTALRSHLAVCQAASIIPSSTAK